MAAYHPVPDHGTGKLSLKFPLNSSLKRFKYFRKILISTVFVRKSRFQDAFMVIIFKDLFFAITKTMVLFYSIHHFTTQRL